jgi:hypothetical protein
MIENTGSKISSCAIVIFRETLAKPRPPGYHPGRQGRFRGRSQSEARIAVMGDADNTDGNVCAWLEYVEVDR